MTELDEDMSGWNLNHSLYRLTLCLVVIRGREAKGKERGKGKRK